jgi:ketosteroid isomerase-like protein
MTKITPASILLTIAAISFCTMMTGVKATLAASRSVASDSSVESMKQQIIAKEREGLDALKAGDVAHFGDLTSDEAILVDAAGPASKAQVLKNVAGFRLTDYSIDNVQFMPLAADTGLIQYKIDEKGVSHGKEFAAKAYVSSIWTKRDHQWLCLFSQESAAH